jgi:hypothetical protein
LLPLAVAATSCAMHEVSTGFVARDVGLVTRGSCDAESRIAAVGESCQRVRGAVVVGPEMDAGAAKAVFDDDLCRSWNSGRPAPFAVGLDLGGSQRIDAIFLMPRWNGPAMHSIEVSSDGLTFVPVLVVGGELLAAQGYAVLLPEPATGRYLRITTTQSEQPVAWREIAPLSCPGS